MRPLLWCLLVLTAEAADSTAPVSVAPVSLIFAHQTGLLGSVPQGVVLTGPAGTVFTATKPIDAGWLLLPNTSGTTVSGSLPVLFPIGVDASGLAPGTYTSTIQFQTPGGTIPVSVSLLVTAAPVLLSSPAVVFVDYTTAPPGLKPVSTVLVGNSNGTFIFLSASTATPWLSVTATGTTVQVTTDPAKVPGDIAVGSVMASVTQNVANKPLSIPVVFLRKGGFSQGPNITRIVNAASWADGPVAPGEIVTLGGTGIGPASLAGLELDAAGKVAVAVAGVQVLFNGKPAPMVYASATQVSAVVPYEIAGASSTTVQVVNNGVGSNVLTVPVATAVPGVFAADSSGAGPGAILNQDNSLNAPGNGAARGSTVTLYVTGEGQTSPAGVTGTVTTAPFPKPEQPVTVSIGGQPAEVTFAGEAPGFVSGFLQVNAQVPQGVPSGEAPLVVTVGGAASQRGVTVSIR